MFGHCLFLPQTLSHRWNSMATDDCGEPCDSSAMSRVEGGGVLEETYSFCPQCSYRNAAAHPYSARAEKCSRLPSATSLSPRSQLCRVCRVLLAPPLSLRLHRPAPAAPAPPVWRDCGAGGLRCGFLALLPPPRPTPSHSRHSRWLSLHHILPDMHAARAQNSHIYICYPPKDLCFFTL